jgi:LysM repeat protein
MVRWKRLFYYLTINIFVSACTTVSVLLLWEKYNPPVIIDFANFSLEELSQVVIPVFLTPNSPGVSETAATPGPTPTRSLADYLVLRGDTLSDIAERYEVSLEELMEINNIDNPNNLLVGQILWVPQPVPEPEPTTSVAIPAWTAIPLENANGNSEVVIVNVVGAGDLATERVRLEYRGEGEYSMQGWRLTSESGSEFVFPMLTLFPDGAIDVYTRVGINSVISLFWGLDAPVWTSGDQVSLFDTNGVLKSSFRVP